MKKRCILYINTYIKCVMEKYSDSHQKIVFEIKNIKYNLEKLLNIYILKTKT